MKVSSASLLLGLAVLLLSGPTVCAVFLDVSPNRLQFLTEESVSLRCEEGQQSSAGWTVRRTVKGRTQRCGDGAGDFGRLHKSSCIISVLSSSTDSGVYWCENNDGQKSPELSITVSDVILEIPLRPVQTGSDITLRCRARDGSVGKAYFFMNGVKRGSGHKGEFTISKVKQTDDGFYSCSTDLSGSSSQSRLTVRDLSPPTTPTPPHHSTLSPDTLPPPPPPPHHSTPSPVTPPPPPSSLASLLLQVVAALVSLMVVVLFLAGVLLLCRKQTGLPVQLLSGLAFSAGLAVLLLSGLTVSAGVFPPPSVSLQTLLCHLVVFCPYCVSTVLMISIYCSRRTGKKRPVSSEMAKRIASEDYVNVTADVTTEHDF
ncbi:uncharacterized protein LOC111236669 [Seriola dumerili]|uniref:uncharacterized protein LOC111236669 n=1 Tax=Seriola dumerili TaxID=41447 RepID=UPI000BBE1134|nr:uncharacterized protein LOC111236669 [Seriola dumerili]